MQVLVQMLRHHQELGNELCSLTEFAVWWANQVLRVKKEEETLYELFLRHVQLKVGETSF